MMARWKWATTSATAFRHWNDSRRRQWRKLSLSAELMVDPGCGARCAIRDTGAPGPGRYHWTVTAFGEPDPVAAGRTGKLAEARHGQRAGRVAARSLTLCLFCRRIETPMPPTSGRSGGGWEGYPRRRSPLGFARPDHDRQARRSYPRRALDPQLSPVC